MGGIDTHLEVAEPDFVIEKGEGENMVDEWLGLACLRGHTKHLHPHKRDTKPSTTNAPTQHNHRQESLTCVNISLINLPHSVSSNPPQKLKRPLLPFKQFPVIFSSSIVCTFWTCIFTLGPLGVLAAQR